MALPEVAITTLKERRRMPFWGEQKMDLPVDRWNLA